MQKLWTSVLAAALVAGIACKESEFTGQTARRNSDDAKKGRKDAGDDGVKRRDGGPDSDSDSGPDSDANDGNGNDNDGDSDSDSDADGDSGDGPDSGGINSGGSGSGGKNAGGNNSGGKNGTGQSNGSGNGGIGGNNSGGKNAGGLGGGSDSASGGINAGDGGSGGLGVDDGDSNLGTGTLGTDDGDSIATRGPATITRTAGDLESTTTIELLIDGDVKASGSVSWEDDFEGAKVQQIASVCRKGKTTCLRISMAGEESYNTDSPNKCFHISGQGTTQITINVDFDGKGLFGGKCGEDGEDDTFVISCPESKGIEVTACD